MNTYRVRAYDVRQDDEIVNAESFGIVQGDLIFYDDFVAAVEVAAFSTWQSVVKMDKVESMDMIEGAIGEDG